jgi:hypothetical protein
MKKALPYIILILFLLSSVAFFVLKTKPEEESTGSIKTSEELLLENKENDFIVSKIKPEPVKLIKFEDLFFDILAERYQMSFYNREIKSANVCLSKAETNSNVSGSIKIINATTKKNYQMKKVTKIDCNKNDCEYRWYFYLIDKSQCYIFDSYLKFQKNKEKDFNFSNIESEKITDLGTKKIIDYIDRIQDRFMLDLDFYKPSDS